MTAEKIILKPWHNEEARDSLFADIVRQQPAALFMLGDLTAAGSRPGNWTPVDNLVNTLRSRHTGVFAIPGNHEYMFGAQKGIRSFRLRFPEARPNGYVVEADSVAVVMLNSNFHETGPVESAKQVSWYNKTIDSLDADPATRVVVVCTHHSPFTNSKIVGESEQIRNLVVPKFEESAKAVCLFSGHSHNLEHFLIKRNKHCLVIGGGGGIKQPLRTLAEGGRPDLIGDSEKPLFFYIMARRSGSSLQITARGFGKDFRFFETDIGIFN